MFGAVIAQVTKLIESRNPQARQYKIKLDDLKGYLSEKNIPKLLQTSAQQAYIYFLNKKSFNDDGTFDGKKKENNSSIIALY